MKRKEFKFEDFKLDNDVINNSAFTQFKYEDSNFKIILNYTAPFAHWSTHCWEIVFYSNINNIVFKTEFESYSSKKESPDKVINILNNNIINILKIYNNLEENEKNNN